MFLRILHIFHTFPKGCTKLLCFPLTSALSNSTSITQSHYDFCFCSTFGVCDPPKNVGVGNLSGEGHMTRPCVGENVPIISPGDIDRPSGVWRPRGPMPSCARGRPPGVIVGVMPVGSTFCCLLRSAFNSSSSSSSSLALFGFLLFELLLPEFPFWWLPEFLFMWS